MTTFLRVLNDKDKQGALRNAVRAGGEGVFEIDPSRFCQIPGAPFAYWVNEAVRAVFGRIAAFEATNRSARQGLATADDFRFVRLWWEPIGNLWSCFAKGGAFSQYYADIYLSIKWSNGGGELGAFSGSVIRNPNFYFRPGVTWPLRTTSGISLRVMPRECVFGHKGPAAFVLDDSPEDLLALLAITNSVPFNILVELQLAAADAAARSYEVGVIQKTPVPSVTAEQRQQLAGLARHAWSLKRTADTITETSHAFVLPAALRARECNDHLPTVEAELRQIKDEIDTLAFDLYGFTEADRDSVKDVATKNCDDASANEDDQDADVAPPSAEGLLAWAVGVAFGRFDWRLATGEREMPPEPDPFDPLPDRSPGMLPVGAAPFHSHAGILVDDLGHPHDLTRLVEEVLERVAVSVPNDVRRWLQRDFFGLHLQGYSKSRRRAPIYWPLSTASGSYTLWLYYPTLSSQTLYIAINDFVDGPSGKLKQVGERATALRNRAAARTRAEETEFEELQAFEMELIELRDTLLRIAKHYHPSMDDGVQTSAAPLWSLFRHKAWQKVLKDTWAKLEMGDYDWAHLTMNYWPGRVREKCRTDKSLAIAHGLEDLYIEPETKPRTKMRSKKNPGAGE